MRPVRKLPKRVAVSANERRMNYRIGYMDGYLRGYNDGNVAGLLPPWSQSEVDAYYARTRGF